MKGFSALSPRTLILACQFLLVCSDSRNSLRGRVVVGGVRGVRTTEPRELKRDKYLHDDHGYSQDGFVVFCEEEMREEAEDGTLTQFEYARFIYDYCRKSPAAGDSCQKKPKKKDSFSSLSVGLQLNFVGSNCPGLSSNNNVSKMECLEFINDEGDPIGYFEEIEELCLSTYPLMVSSGMLDTSK